MVSKLESFREQHMKLDMKLKMSSRLESWPMELTRETIAQIMISLERRRTLMNQPKIEMLRIARDIIMRLTFIPSSHSAQI
jgi:hypothetical protein